MDQELRAAQATLGRQLHDLRKAAGLTQQQLATMTFTSRSSIACIETGRQNSDRTFWRRADEAIGAAGTLVAGYEHLRALLDRQARYRAATPTRTLVAAALTACASRGHPASRIISTLDIRTVLSPYKTADRQAGEPTRQVVSPRRAAEGYRGRERRTGDPVGTGRIEAEVFPAERSHELFVRGYALLAANDRREIETAKVLLDRSVMREPQFARAIAARGYASWRQYFAGWTKHAQALTSAMSDIHTALTVDSDSVLAHLAFVRVCWDMGWHEPALAAGRLVFDRHPDSLDATLAFARALNNAGLSQFALPLVDSILTADPTNPAAVKLRIWCHLMVGNFDHSVGAAIDYLPRHPTDANTRWATALAYRHLPSAAAEALKTIEDAAAADPSDITVWVLLGYLRRDLSGGAAAVEGWRAGLAHVDGHDVSNNRVMAWLANLYAALGEDRRALAIVHDLRSREPGNGYLCYRLAHVLAELGRGDEAIEMLNHAVDCGFLSAQLARREEVLATARICTSERYRATMRRLEDRVAECASVYADDILPVSVAPVAIAAGATNDSSRQQQRLGCRHRRRRHRDHRRPAAEASDISREGCKRRTGASGRNG